MDRKEKNDLQNNCDKPPEGAEVVEVMETSVLKQEKHMVAPNSNYWEHSENSLVDEAGEALRQKTHEEEAKMKSNVKLQEEDRKYGMWYKRKRHSRWTGNRGKSRRSQPKWKSPGQSQRVWRTFSKLVG